MRFFKSKKQKEAEALAEQERLAKEAEEAKKEEDKKKYEADANRRIKLKTMQQKASALEKKKAELIQKAKEGKAKGRDMTPFKSEYVKVCSSLDFMNKMLSIFEVGMFTADVNAITNDFVQGLDEISDVLNKGVDIPKMTEANTKFQQAMSNNTKQQEIVDNFMSVMQDINISDEGSQSQHGQEFDSMVGTAEEASLAGNTESLDAKIRSLQEGNFSDTQK